MFLLFYGQALRIFPAKFVLMFAIVLFETGSLVRRGPEYPSAHCRPNGIRRRGSRNLSVFLFSSSPAADSSADMGTIQIVTQITRVQDRARLYGLFGAVLALSSVIGPLIGDGLTDHVTWARFFNSLSKQTRSDTRLKRWCFNRFNLFTCLTKHLRYFYLNLPLAASPFAEWDFYSKHHPLWGPTARAHCGTSSGKLSALIYRRNSHRRRCYVLSPCTTMGRKHQGLDCVQCLEYNWPSPSKPVS